MAFAMCANTLAMAFIVNAIVTQIAVEFGARSSACVCLYWFRFNIRSPSVSKDIVCIHCYIDGDILEYAVLLCGCEHEKWRPIASKPKSGQRTAVEWVIGIVYPVTAADWKAFKFISSIFKWKFMWITFDKVKRNRHANEPFAADTLHLVHFWTQRLMTTFHIPTRISPSTRSGFKGAIQI